MRCLVALLLCLTVGCVNIETQYQKKKRILEEKVELLKLEKRKARLELQLEELEERL
jgi:hypothetical protein